MAPDSNPEYSMHPSSSHGNRQGGVPASPTAQDAERRAMAAYLSYSPFDEAREETNAVTEPPSAEPPSRHQPLMTREEVMQALRQRRAAQVQGVVAVDGNQEVVWFRLLLPSLLQPNCC